MKKEMKKEKPVNLKITPLDRMEALIRNKSFREELSWAISCEKRNPDGRKILIPDRVREKRIREFSEKYNMIVPSNYSYQSLDECLELLREIFLHEGFKDDFTTRLVPVEGLEFIDVDEPDELHNQHTMLAIEEYPGAEILSFQSYNKNPYIKEGKYLTVEINLRKDKTDILAEIGKHIDDCSPEKNKTRISSTNLNIWEIYDLSQNLTPLKIARQKSGIDGNPSYDPILDKHLKSVGYALDKAHNIMKQVYSEVNLPLQDEK